MVPVIVIIIRLKNDKKTNIFFGETLQDINSLNQQIAQLQEVGPCSCLVPYYICTLKLTINFEDKTSDISQHLSLGNLEKFA